jgi:hypothetical protein
MRKRVLIVGLINLVGLMSLALTTAGCKQDNESEARTSPQEQAATVSTAPVVDNKIAKAVANAAKAAPAVATAEGGPPENGVLGAARADSELRRGAPPKLKLGSAGNEPKLQLGVASGTENTAFDKRSGSVEVSVRTGASMMPSTAVKLDFSQPGNSLPSSAPTTNTVLNTPGASVVPVQGVVPVVASVAQSDLGRTQPGQIPPELAAEIRKLKGTQLTFQTAQGALVGAPTIVLSKGANPQLETLVQAAGAGVVDAAIAFPKEPVGVGAFWMVTSREVLLGTDVVCYRMVKVVEITDGKARLEINTKRYLADGNIGLPGIEDAKVHQFHAEGTSQLVVGTGQTLPSEGRSQTTIRAFAEIEGTPRPIPIELRSEFGFK